MTQRRWIWVPETMPIEGGGSSGTRGLSYRDTLHNNDPNLTFETRKMYNPSKYQDEPEDDEQLENKDLMCPTILLTAIEKRMLLEPWQNALIVKLFDKGIGYTKLKKGLKKKWALKGDFFLIDIGHDYYVMRLTNMDDYVHVMINGP